MKRFITLILVALAMTAVVAKSPPKKKAPAKAAVVLAKQPINANCVMVAANHSDCDLFASVEPIGIGIAPGVYATFTNRTGETLRINEVSAITNERESWSEFCVYHDDFLTGQNTAGMGEVGCSAKNIGEDYAPIHWGAAGLLVAPGSVVYVGSHTEPEGTNHLYSLMVSAAGVQAWRQPQMDVVNYCNGQQQSTPWNPWSNPAGYDLRVSGASIYVEAGGATPKQLTGAACVYVLRADGTLRTGQCDDALRTRGDAALDLVLAPGESVAAQAVNTCAAPGLWGWAAFFRVSR